MNLKTSRRRKFSYATLVRNAINRDEYLATRLARYCAIEKKNLNEAVFSLLNEGVSTHIQFLRGGLI